MNYQNFRSLMEKMGDSFPVSNLDGKKRVYFEVLDSRLSDNQFEKTVNLLLRTTDRFSTIKTILETARNFQEAPVVEERKANCVACENKGTIRVKDRDGYQALFRCPECENCVAGYPMWSQDWKDTGWNLNDEHQLKGLAMMGPSSITWKKAPLEMQEKAKSLIAPKEKNAKVPIHIGQVDVFSKPDNIQERERKKNIGFTEHSFPEKSL